MKNSGIVFLAVLFMLGCAFLSQMLMKDMQGFFMVSFQNPHQLVMYKLWSFIPSFLGVIGLMLLSWGGKAERAIHTFFLLCTGVFAALACLDVYGSSLLENNNLLIFSYLWLSFAVPLPMIVIWGYAHQEFSSKKAALFYPCLFALLIVVPLLFVQMLNSSVFSNVQLQFTALAILNFLIWIVFFFVNRLDNVEPEEKQEGASGLYWLGLVLLALGLKYVNYFPDLLLKMQIREMFSSVSNDYIAFMGTLASYKGVVSLLFVPIGFFIGILLYIVGYRWLTYIGAALLFVLSVSGLSFIQTTNLPFNEDTFALPLLSYFLFTGLLLFFTSLVFLWFFFGMERKKRFAAQLLIGGIIFPLGRSLSSLTVQAMVSIQGKVLADPLLYCFIFVGGIFVAALGLGFAYRYGKFVKV